MRKTHRAGFSPAIARLARSPETRDRELIITAGSVGAQSLDLLLLLDGRSTARVTLWSRAM
jgi:hypothetical protein